MRMESRTGRSGGAEGRKKDEREPSKRAILGRLASQSQAAVGRDREDEEEESESFGDGFKQPRIRISR